MRTWWYTEMDSPFLCTLDRIPSCPVGKCLWQNTEHQTEMRIVLTPKGCHVSAEKRRTAAKEHLLQGTLLGNSGGTTCDGQQVVDSR